jgi:hypothetical protein
MLGFNLDRNVCNVGKGIGKQFQYHCTCSECLQYLGSPISHPLTCNPDHSVEDGLDVLYGFLVICLQLGDPAFHL